MAEVIILAGGLGTRLRTAVADVPKVLAPVNGRPFLDVILQRLQRSGIVKKVILAVGYKSESIENYYSEASPFGLEIVFSREESLLGTGGAIKQALELATGNTVLVMNGDTFLDVDYRDMHHSHQEKKAIATIALTQVSDAEHFGTVSFNEDHRITSFREKVNEANGFINAGVYIFERSLFDNVSTGAVVSLEHDLFPSFLEGNMYAFVTAGDFIDIGTPDSYRLAASILGGRDDK